MSKNEKSIETRAAVFYRFIPPLSYAIPAVGAALSSVAVSRVMRSVEAAGSSGLLAVAAGIAESSQPVLIALYLAIFCGVAVIVVAAIRSPATIVSPSVWFFLVAATFGFFPALLLWKAESMLILALPASREGVVAGASIIKLLLTVSLIGGLGSLVVLLVGATWAAPIGARSKWRTLATLILIEIVLVVLAVFFQVRMSWLRNLYLGQS